MVRDDPDMTGTAVMMNGRRLRFREVAEDEEPDLYLTPNPPSQALLDELISMIGVLPDPLFSLVRDRLKELLASGRLYTQEVTAIRAPHVYVDLLPCSEWVDLMSAFRAGDLDGVARFAHGGSLQGG